MEKSLYNLFLDQEFDGWVVVKFALPESFGNGRCLELIFKKLPMYATNIKICSKRGICYVL